MKYLKAYRWVLLLSVLGIAGCGADSSPSGDGTALSAAQDSQVKVENGSAGTPQPKVDEPSAQAAESDPVAALEKLGAMIIWGVQGKVSTVHLFEATTDADLVHLKGLTGLRKLNLVETKITDAGLVHLKELTGLKRLDFRDTEVTDAGLVHLKGLTELKDLGLHDTKVTDAGLVHLKGLTELKDLDLFRTKITDAGLVHLKELTKLQDLDLFRTKITDAGLVHLKGLTKLQSLNLGGTKITDAGLVHLKGLTELKDLGLYRTKVTDAGLVHLKGLTKLRDLDLRDTQVTKAGVDNLQKALPETTIDEGEAKKECQAEPVIEIEITISYQLCQGIQFIGSLGYERNVRPATRVDFAAARSTTAS